MGGLQRYQHVHMIRHAADAFRLSAEPAYRAAEVVVKTGAPRRVDERCAAVCGENQVVMQRNVRGGHGCRESGGGKYGVLEIWMRLASLRDAWCFWNDNPGVSS